jgi:hypothetical protein
VDDPTELQARIADLAVRVRAHRPLSVVLAAWLGRDIATEVAGDSLEVGHRLQEVRLRDRGRAVAVVRIQPSGVAGAGVLEEQQLAGTARRVPVRAVVQHIGGVCPDWDAVVIRTDSRVVSPAGVAVAACVEEVLAAVLHHPAAVAGG